MTVQMTVRIPDELAEFVDSEVANGAKSRAEVIARALRREVRRRRAEHDAAIYAAKGEDPELESLIEWSTQNAARIWADLD